MTGQLVRALLAPACYPHATGTIRLLETHISWVLLTGAFAYKVKKPVNFGFVDYSTLARRKFFCEEELRLNTRFGAGLYLDVVAIAGTVEQPAVIAAGHEPTGPVLEYAVRMREFAQQDLLAALAAAGALTNADMEALGKTLAGFHDRLAARLPRDAPQLGTAHAIGRVVLENFAQIQPLLATDAARRELAVLEQWTRQEHVRLGPLFASRHAAGFVRECHGDLHLNNIARIDGALTLFDCIEFNAQYRWIDIQSELAFVLMDLECKQLPALANRLLNTWLEHTGDYAGLATLRFYEVYRAMVRAKVSVLKLSAAALSTAEATRAWQEYAAYLALARGYCETRAVFLGIMHGVSGTGKSTVAATLAGACHAIRIRSDVERKRLFGLATDARADSARMAQLYDEAATRRTFAVLEELARNLLRLGYPVLVDATFIAEKWRRPFRLLARSQGVPFVIVDCQASQATIRRRLQERQALLQSASDADIAVMLDQLGRQEPFTGEEQAHVLAIDTEQPVNADGLRHRLNQA